MNIWYRCESLMQGHLKSYLMSVMVSVSLFLLKIKFNICSDASGLCFIDTQVSCRMLLWSSTRFSFASFLISPVNVLNLFNISDLNWKYVKGNLFFYLLLLLVVNTAVCTRFAFFFSSFLFIIYIHFSYFRILTVKLTWNKERYREDLNLELDLI